MIKYLVFGETIWDVYPDKCVIGGAPFNFSAHTALLGGDVYLVTGVGRDELGDKALGYIKDYGIHDDFICRNDKATGRCVVALDERGVPRYNVLTDTAYDNIVLSGSAAEKMRALRPDVLYFNTLAQRNAVSRSTLLGIIDSVPFRHVFCDINIRPGCWSRESLSLCMEKTTIVKISEEEAHFLTDCGLIAESGGSFAESVHSAFPNLELLVYTMGAKGSIVYDFKNGTEVASGEPEQVEVVSTVGAGDCYSASFVYSYLSGVPIRDAVKEATERSNIVVANTEAIPEEFLHKHN